MDWRGLEWTQFQHIFSTPTWGYPPPFRFTLFRYIDPAQRWGCWAIHCDESRRFSSSLIQLTPLWYGFKIAGWNISTHSSVCTCSVVCYQVMQMPVSLIISATVSAPLDIPIQILFCGTTNYLIQKAGLRIVGLWSTMRMGSGTLI